ncbi:MAG: electron transfer flavoprotein-ubiquinone oxidoreductase [Thermodesulfobacteriota bacterium]|nr:electron transfer flavoprotein-ubiquinone oxidoreductase [Thermodesulfobacteriota bacterium]
MASSREQIEFDVLFVGGGPANLAGAVHLMELAKGKGQDLEVALIEKGDAIGAHALSGAVLNPRALKELVPDYREAGCPIEKDVRGDALYFLTERCHYAIPFVPNHMRNEGCHIISLSRFVRWLATVAEGLGVNLFAGFAGKEVLYGKDGKSVVGVRTGDKGLGKDGKPKSNFEPGIDILARVTVFGEGARGSLVGSAAERLKLFAGRVPQTFETGIKEVIELPEKNYFTGSDANDLHLFGYPLGLNTHGGGFVYEMADNRVALGLLTALSYQDPMLDLYEEFMRFKGHPFLRGIIKGGRVIEQGARVVGSGGYFTVPKLAVDGAMFVGATASMFNAPALKGIHTSMKSGMLAAETILESFTQDNFKEETLLHYEDLFEESWLKQELYVGRNFAQAASKKGPLKLLHLGIQYLTGGRGLFEKMSVPKDSKTLKPLRPGALDPSERRYGHHDDDGTLFVDKLTGVYLSKTHHLEDQPCHLVVKDLQLCVTRCYETYRSPCTRFCPGNVYEMGVDETTQERRLKLNPSNCLHCKTCDIKDPYDNITWTCPEGGDGPGYTVL